METNALIQLIKKYNAGLCTPEEKSWLEQWYLSFEWTKSQELPATVIQKFKDTVWNNLQLTIVNQSIQNNPVNTVHKPVKRWWYYSAAASFLILISISLYLYMDKKPQNNPAITDTGDNISQLPVLPGTSRASLEMGDGSVITLDSAAVTKLTTDDGTIIDKQHGTITYKNTTEAADKITYNTLRIPRGGEYQLVLPDGSKVWMNAASSLKFPTRFAGKERIVYLTGEAYFEVVSNSLQPFKVMVENEMEVQVVGTHFNVMAYTDESAIKTTLAEGKVIIKTNTNSTSLVPAQQAVLFRESKQTEVKKVDIDKEIAWKNGMIEFYDDGLPYIMRQLARWYDVEVSFEGMVPGGTYSGSIPRKALLSEVMQILSIAGIKYKLNNKQIIITGG